MKAEIEVIKPGMFSTIQDQGRFGFREYGVPLSGPMDTYSSRMANLILGNSPDAALMEITQMGPTLRFSAASQIVVCGALLSPSLNDQPIQNNRIYEIAPEDQLSFGKRIIGCRAYLALKHGFKSEEILGSRSWYTGITSFAALEKGMRVSYSEVSGTKDEHFSAVKFRNQFTSAEVEVYPGPEFDLLSQEQQNFVENSSFAIGRNNNRMGIQLQDELKNDLDPILTGPVLPGTVQLTPSGKLIILMRDGQTTGGYPRVLQGTNKGMDILAQKVMGDSITFEMKS